MLEKRDEDGNLTEVIVDDDDLIDWGWLSPSGTFMLPGHPDFHSIKDASIPEFLGGLLQDSKAHHIMIQRVGSDISEVCTEAEFDEYMMGGEYDARMQELNLTV